MMKLILFLLSFLLATNNLFACLAASQNRLFPLGVTSKGLCVVETHLYRSEFSGGADLEMKPAWNGVSYFKIYDNNYKVVYSKIIDTIKQFRQSQYNSAIEGSLKKGLKLASRYKDFVPGKPLSLSFCDYREKCSKAGLVFDISHNKVKVQLPNKKKYVIPVLFDPASIASNVLDYHRSFEATKLTAKSFKGNLYLNSVRRFQVAHKTLTIVHIGCGQVIERSKEGAHLPGKTYKAAFVFKDLNKSIFEEPVLHHGHGFDFYIWE